ncbi:MAG: CHAT domain-containing protein [Salibacteraceae bacterium]
MEDSAYVNYQNQNFSEASRQYRKVAHWHLQQNDCSNYCKYWKRHLACLMMTGKSYQVITEVRDTLSACLEQMGPDTAKGEVLLSLGNAYMATGQYENSGAVFQRMDTMGFKDPVLQFKIQLGLNVGYRRTGQFYQHRKCLKRASELLEQIPVEQAQPLKSDLMDFWAFSLYRDSDALRAISYGKEAIRYAKANQEPNYVLGNLYLKLSLYHYDAKQFVEGDSTFRLAKKYQWEANQDSTGREYLSFNSIEMMHCLQRKDAAGAAKALKKFEAVQRLYLPPNKASARLYRLKGRYFQLEGRADSALFYLEKSALLSANSYSLIRYGIYTTDYISALDAFDQPEAVLREGTKSLHYIAARLGTLDNPALIGDLMTQVVHLEKLRATVWYQRFRDKGNILDLDSAAAAIKRAVSLNNGRILTRLSANYLGRSAEEKGLYALGMKVYQAQFEVDPDPVWWQRALYLASSANVLRLSGLMALEEARETLSDSLLTKGDQLYGEMSQLRLLIFREREANAVKDSLKTLFSSKQIEYDFFLQRLLNQLPDFAVFQPNMESRVYQPEPNQAFLQFLETEEATFALASGPGGFVIHELDTNWEALQGRFLSAIRKNRKEQMAEEGAALYQLLISPLAPAIERATNWTIVPSGKLFHLPFAALLEQPVDDPFRAFGQWPFLVNRTAVQYAYSSTNLDRTSRTAALTGMQFLGFAPVFMDPNASDAVTRGRRLRRSEVGLRPLPETAKELQMIQNRMLEQGAKPVLKIYDQARESEFKALAPHYDVIHLASHGFYPKADPRISRLAFATPDSTEDGSLYTTELYPLDLKAKLVVVSSCESGAGEVVYGEGLVGFGHGLLYAGAERILVSRWKIYDEHTYRLMDQFYTLWPSEDEGEALAQAQRALLQNPRTSSPKIWAAFSVMQR